MINKNYWLHNIFTQIKIKVIFSIWICKSVGSICFSPPSRICVYLLYNPGAGLVPLQLTNPRLMVQQNTI